MPTAQDAVVQQRTSIGPPFKFRKEPAIGFVLIHEQKPCQSQRDLDIRLKHWNHFLFPKAANIGKPLSFCVP
jgi:hypothetical protein